MSSKSRYHVIFFTVPFKTLEYAKWNIRTAFTPDEAKRYLKGERIIHYIGDKMHSETPINVDDDGVITFGRTIKLFNQK